MRASRLAGLLLLVATPGLAQTAGTTPQLSGLSLSMVAARGFAVPLMGFRFVNAVGPGGRLILPDISFGTLFPIPVLLALDAHAGYVVARGESAMLVLAAGPSLAHFVFGDASMRIGFGAGIAVIARGDPDQWVRLDIGRRVIGDYASDGAWFVGISFLGQRTERRPCGCAQP